MKYKVILFDLDGTLTDPQEGICNCITHALSYYGISKPHSELTQFIGPPLLKSFATGKFNTPKDYEGWFSGASATIWNAKAYTAWSGTCFVVGVGMSTSKFSASTGATWYILSSSIYEIMSNVYDRVVEIGKTIKKK